MEQHCQVLIYRHLEAVERYRESFARGLDIRLFACPATVEGVRPGVVRQRPNGVDFAIGQELSGDLFQVRKGSNPLDVYAE